MYRKGLGANKKILEKENDYGILYVLVDANPSEFAYEYVAQQEITVRSKEGCEHI